MSGLGSGGMVPRRARAARDLALALWLCLAAGSIRAAERPGGDAWFDPKQLPTFTGTIDRIVTAELGRRLHDAFKAGDRLTVYGVRARQAPVISALAVQLPGPAA